jgi:hemerythrin-like metal-binding protein
MKMSTQNTGPTEEAVDDLISEVLVGEETIDAQHRKIVRLMAHVQTLALDEEADLRRAVAALVEHVRTHFADEEKLMAQSGYPDLATHRAHHVNMLRDLMMVVASTGGEAELSQEVAGTVRRFVEAWVIGHVRHADREFAGYYRDRRSSS